VSLASTLKQSLRRVLERRGYEVYKRPHLPKGADAFLSLRSHWPDFQPARIFDVGANTGQTVGRLRPLFPDAHIDCFEPVPAALERLRAATAADPRVAVHPIGLSDRAGEAMIHLHDSVEQSSLSPGIAAQLPPDAKFLRVPLDTVDDHCRREGIARLGLLKIDVEGHERAVLQGASSLLAEGGVDFLVLEAGLGVPQPRFTPLSDLAALLQPQGYHLIGVYEQFGYRYCQTAEFCNALFAHERHLTT
jgi:FkbM family methyltransferase